MVGAAPPPTPRRLTSSIFAPAKTGPIWTLSEPVTKVFANGGGSPPTPPLFFLMPYRFKNPEPVINGVCKLGGLRPPHHPPRLKNTMQPGSQESRTINKNCIKHVVVMAFFLRHHTGSLFANERFANGWGCALSKPPAFFTPCRLVFKRAQYP